LAERLARHRQVLVHLLGGEIVAPTLALPGTPGWSLAAARVLEAARARAEARDIGVASPPTGPVPGRGPCYACRQERWWRCADADPSDCWTCGSCHPPMPALRVIWARAQEVSP
jgi:hypothetical protein